MNRYGVYTDYFKKKLELVIRDLDYYTPEELGRELAKLSLTALDEGKKCLTINEDNTMIYLNGRANPSFRCDCGCNVFHTYKEMPKHYFCNACGISFEGED